MVDDTMTQTALRDAEREIENLRADVRRLTSLHIRATNRLDYAVVENAKFLRIVENYIRVDRDPNLSVYVEDNGVCHKAPCIELREAAREARDALDYASDLSPQL
jgi:hypothetical protein